MTQSALITLNVFMYLITFLVGLKFYGKRNLGVYMLLLYTLSSVFSYLFFNHPLFINSLNYVSNGIELEGVGFLYIVNMLLVLPFLRIDMSKIHKLKHIDFRIFYKILIVCSVLYVLQFLMNVPQMIKIGNVSSSMLSDLRNETYESGSFESKSSIILAMSRLLGGVRFLYLFLSILGFFIDRKRKKFYLICLSIYILGFIQTSLLWVARAPMVHEFLVLSTFFLFFFDSIPSIIRKRILVFSSIILSLGLLFIITITYSRFGDTTGNSSNLVTFSLIRYLGEPQINFLGLLYDNTNGNLYGYKSFMLFRRALGMTYMDGFDKTAHFDYMSNMMNCPSYFLYQLAGAIYSDWGKVGTLAFCIIFSLYIFLLTSNIKEIPVYTLCTVLFLSTVVSKGIFYPDFASEMGNLMFVFLFLFFLLSRFWAHYNVIIKKRRLRK